MNSVFLGHSYHAAVCLSVNFSDKFGFNQIFAAVKGRRHHDWRIILAHD